MLTPLIEIAKPQRVLGLIGQYGIGKDYVARLIPEALILKAADPLYQLVHLLAGALAPFSKGDPGGRETLTRVGAWGRGDVSEQHPWSAERVAFVHYVRHNLGKEWARFGGTPHFWAEMLERGILTSKPKDRPMVCTDVRFGNEAAVCRSHGSLAVILCYPDTLRERRAACGYAARVDDASENMAERYAKAFQGFSATDELHRLALADSVSTFIWNDPAPVDRVVLGLAERHIKVVDPKHA